MKNIEYLLLGFIFSFCCFGLYASEDNPCGEDDPCKENPNAQGCSGGNSGNENMSPNLGE